MTAFGFAMDALEDETIEVEPDMPFTEILNEENNYIVLKFNNKVDWINAMGLLGVERVRKLSTKKDNSKQGKEWKERYGVGRVIDGVKAIERMQSNEA